jgi:hypothetical protein
VKLSYFLSAYRATPHSTAGYSPFSLLHGREIVTPTNENLRPKGPKPTKKPEQLIESLQTSLRQAYRAVAKANRKSYVTNEKLYDKRAKHRSFEVGIYVYLFNPVRKQVLSEKFFSVLSGPFRVTAKISDLNYEILGRNGRKFVVHLNGLKACHGRTQYGQNPARKQPGMSRQKLDMKSGPDQEADMYPAAILSCPFASVSSRARDFPQSQPTSPLASPEATIPSSAVES